MYYKRKKGDHIMPSLKKITTLRLDDELSEKLKILALEDNRSLNNYIEQILKKHVESIEIKTHRQIQIGNNSNVQIGSNISYNKGNK